MTVNAQWQLARRPAGGLPEAADFAWQQVPLPEPGPDQMLTRTLYLSLDPYQWGRLRGGATGVGEVCHGRTVSQVVASRLDGYVDGDFVFNTNGWQRYALTGAGISVFNYMFPRKLDATLAPISTAVGVLGMLGLTAWVGTCLQCAPRPGQTLVVSAASGGVGQVAGQIGRILGARVVGVAGAPAKCAFVTDVLGFDACVSHLSPNLADELRAACPDGVDAYFENVGGSTFSAVLPLLNRGARIALCGMVSQYARTDGVNARQAWQAQGEPVFASRAVSVHDLFVGHFVAAHEATFLAQMTAWVRAGRIRYREDVWRGLEQAPTAFRAMLEGGNFGKTLVSVGTDPTLDAGLAARRAAGNTLAPSSA